MARKEATMPTEGGSSGTPIKSAITTPPTSGSGDSPPTSQSTPMFVSSTGQSSDSKRHWQKPVDVKGFAAQANEVATRVLNGTIDLDTAKTFASIARVVSQAASLEVQRGRFLKEMPNLSLEFEES